MLNSIVIFIVLTLFPSNHSFTLIFVHVSFTGQRILTSDVAGTKECKTTRAHSQQGSQTDPGNNQVKNMLLSLDGLIVLLVIIKSWPRFTSGDGVLMIILISFARVSILWP